MSFETILFQPYSQSSSRIISSGVNALNLPHAVSPLAAGEDYIFGGSTNCQTVSSRSSPVVYGGLFSKSNTAASSASAPITATSSTTTVTAATPTATVTASSTSSPMVTGVRKRIKLPGIQPLPVVLTSACLTFIRSEMYRHDQHNVISLTTQFFSFDELKNARKILYEKCDPTKKHPFRCPTDTNLKKEKASHCTASIILKFNEMENKGSEITVACPAEDLYRVTQIRNSASFSLEQRVLQLEKEMKEVKSAVVSKPHAPALPVRKPPPAYTSREGLISDVSRNVPFRSSSPSVTPGKRNRSTSDEEWETARNKKNGERPQSKKSRQSYWSNNAATHWGKLQVS